MEKNASETQQDLVRPNMIALVDVSDVADRLDVLRNSLQFFPEDGVIEEIAKPVLKHVRQIAMGKEIVPRGSFCHFPDRLLVLFGTHLSCNNFGALGNCGLADRGLQADETVKGNGMCSPASHIGNEVRTRCTILFDLRLVKNITDTFVADDPAQNIGCVLGSLRTGLIHLKIVVKDELPLVDNQGIVLVHYGEKK